MSRSNPPCDGTRFESCDAYASSLKGGEAVCGKCGTAIRQVLTQILDRHIDSLAAVVDKREPHDQVALIKGACIDIAQQVEAVESPAHAHVLLTVRLLESNVDMRQEIDKHVANIH